MCYRYFFFTVLLLFSFVNIAKRSKTLRSSFRFLNPRQYWSFILKDLIFSARPRLVFCSSHPFFLTNFWFFTLDNQADKYQSWISSHKHGYIFIYNGFQSKKQWHCHQRQYFSRTNTVWPTRISVPHGFAEPGYFYYLLENLSVSRMSEPCLLLLLGSLHCLRVAEHANWMRNRRGTTMAKVTLVVVKCSTFMLCNKCIEWYLDVTMKMLLLRKKRKSMQLRGTHFNLWISAIFLVLIVFSFHCL